MKLFTLFVVCITIGISSFADSDSEKAEHSFYSESKVYSQILQIQEALDRQMEIALRYYYALMETPMGKNEIELQKLAIREIVEISELRTQIDQVDPLLIFDANYLKTRILPVAKKLREFIDLFPEEQKDYISSVLGDIRTQQSELNQLTQAIINNFNQMKERNSLVLKIRTLEQLDSNFTAIASQTTECKISVKPK